MLPSVFGENLFDDFFDDAFLDLPGWGGRGPLYGGRGKQLMRTDVRETEQAYELDVDLPGFRKDELQVELKNGYLTIRASKRAPRVAIRSKRTRRAGISAGSAAPAPAAAASMWAMWNKRMCPPGMRTAS